MSKQHNGVSLDEFARQTGIRKGQLLYYCQKGRIEGAQFDKTLWQLPQVTPRRIRFLLDAGRLQGRRQDNGYWKVFYSYRVIDGLRGPALRRHKKQERKAECYPWIT